MQVKVTGKTGDGGIDGVGIVKPRELELGIKPVMDYTVDEE